ncbi:MAG: hypothetical protein A2087_05460 [Spirochaetes bacterium GWD1_61_31]|nr:MAG: hypothetical protein A2Y37_03730 [Spirochaetes bacterium GWB1_60_80]OHD35088.1 MAG: hypothetical protein A2004_05205 [Spirochaetes bacterium GWC1_61_12]OHD43605.1 MAG: hypothetical protein A2087_05460 [Spirochaetes bacterium GWD1_61_31]OHD44097.1 MAG: hypothetical protein A2Y35_01885 [Spirochaetes bacterium GWE1_60_18]OHD61862.1 MAG: hypothetical protein A2Y32_13990 [Spirochaetes bacterium GWF1_60_12]HAP43231.1 MFS transporter [Spirochaetaceae bacterium]
MLTAFVNRFLHWAVVGIISPVLVLMLLSRQVPLELVGVIMALMSLGVVVFELPSGILSDLIGRKRVYLLSLGISLAALALLLALDGLVVLCLGFGLYGVARAFASGSIESAFIDAFIRQRGKDKLHTLITVMNCGEAAGLAGGAVAGGFIPGLWQAVLPGAPPYHGNLLVQVVILVIIFIMTLGYRDEPKADARLSLKQLLTEAGQAIKANPLIKLLLAGAFVWGGAFSALEVYWQPRLKVILPAGEGSVRFFGLLNSGYFLAAIAGSLLMNRILTRIKGRRLLVSGLIRLAVGLAFAALAAQGGVVGFSVFFLLVMLFNGMLNVPEGTIFNSEIPADKRASFLSLVSFVLQLGGILAGLGFSLLTRWLPIPALWLIAAAIFSASGLAYLAFLARAPFSAP